MPIIGISSNFNKLLEKATSNLNLEPEWPTILSICDLIRQGDVSPKNALVAINKKITHENPHTAGFGLLVLESCVKNCGSPIHDEVCTKQYMEQLKEIAKTTQQESVRKKILELIQAWAYAFRDSPKYRAVQDTMRIMKAENFEFPALQESDAMFSADIAPEWVDGDKCHRCRVAFNTFNRKHHCRACGQVFCSQCSGKFSTIPKYGIEKEVRVCNTCYDQVNKPVVVTSKPETDLPIEYLTSSLAQQQQVPPKKTEEELREEEELQIALALSQSEAEHKEKEKKRATSAIISNSTAFTKIHYSPPPSPVSILKSLRASINLCLKNICINLMPKEPSPKIIQEEEEVDPELAKYLNRQYWEQRQSALEEQTARLNVTSPSAPNIGSSPMPQKVIAIKQQNGEVDPEMKSFVENLRSQVEIFVNRMKSDSSRGRSIANDSSVQTLFMNITALHSRLLKYIQDQEDNRVYYEGLQDKLTQIKDARGALDALREEHRLALLREKQEAERKKQMQMAQKLEIMRKKKQEYLQYQRELALRNIQEQEREMQMRQEQQKQQYKQLAGGFQSIPGFMGPPNQGSPVRQMQFSAGPEAAYNSLPTTNPQSIYAYAAGGGTGTYSSPTNWPMQHQQMVNPSAITDTKPPTVESQQPAENPESLGRVTVSGPGIQIPAMRNRHCPGHPQQQQQQQPQLKNIQIPGQVSQQQSHIPTTTQSPSGHTHVTIANDMQMPLHLDSTQMLPRQQIVIGQGQGIQLQQGVSGRRLPMQSHPIGPNVSIPGSTQVVMRNDIMPGAQHMQGIAQISGPQQMQGAQQIPTSQHIQGPQQISNHQQMMQGPQQIQNSQQMVQNLPTAVYAPLQDVRVGPMQLLPQQQQQPHQQQQQNQQPPLHQQQQEQQPMVIQKVEEEERKSPEVAELISFD
ncbi:hepatocyte growth factor-regulated tyrosine kinase substrate isoform X2 [Copidosoma floridanum]|uniref:hepatocyte growth factor-regulated tyrosine kinase substrate isoform X2 n=1 Tax=Copidosoma floridanum TaxID=29053 RepID=UPI000C6F610A|nr:hepatocyte growth factor-regulated tyrosine kinase substrate isoform X2 [Copidosoma floridanum]